MIRMALQWRGQFSKQDIWIAAMSHVLDASPVTVTKFEVTLLASRSQGFRSLVEANVHANTPGAANVMQENSAQFTAQLMMMLTLRGESVDSASILAVEVVTLAPTPSGTTVSPAGGSDSQGADVTEFAWCGGVVGVIMIVVWICGIGVLYWYRRYHTPRQVVPVNYATRYAPGNTDVSKPSILKEV